MLKLSCIEKLEVRGQKMFLWKSKIGTQYLKKKHENIQKLENMTV